MVGLVKPICHTRWDMLGGAGYRAKDRKQRYGWCKWILGGAGYRAMILSNDICNDILAKIFRAMILGAMIF